MSGIDREKLEDIGHNSDDLMSRYVAQVIANCLEDEEPNHEATCDCGACCGEHCMSKDLLPEAAISTEDLEEKKDCDHLSQKCVSYQCTNCGENTSKKPSQEEPKCDCDCHNIGEGELGYYRKNHCGMCKPSQPCACGKGDPTKSTDLNVEEPAIHSPTVCKHIEDNRLAEIREENNRYIEVRGLSRDVRDLLSIIDRQREALEKIAKTKIGWKEDILSAMQALPQIARKALKESV